jgi:hypothetical protein
LEWAETGWWENVKSLAWILTPFWIIFFWAKWGLKCFLKQVQNGFICWIQLRNGCVRAKKNSSWWRHLHLIRIFEVLKKKSSTILFHRTFHLIWLSYGKCMLGGHFDFFRHFVSFAPIYLFNFYYDFDFQNISLDSFYTQ